MEDVSFRTMKEWVEINVWIERAIIVGQTKILKDATFAYIGEIGMVWKNDTYFSMSVHILMIQGFVLKKIHT